MMWQEAEKCQDTNHGWLFMPHEKVWGFYIGNWGNHMTFQKENVET